jgi:hypothetical protein
MDAYRRGDQFIVEFDLPGPPFPRSATHLRGRTIAVSGVSAILFCIRARDHSARSTRAARTASRGFARAIARPRGTRRIALR